MPSDASELLNSPAQYAKGVGPQRAELLRRLGIDTIEQLLFFLPRDYQDLTDVRPINRLEPKKLQTVWGRIVDLDARETRKQGTLAAALIEDGTGRLRAVWFNQPMAIKRFQVGDFVIFSGKPTWHMGCWEMAHPQAQTTDDGRLSEPILPVYSLTEDLRMGDLRRIMRHAVPQFAGLVPDCLPESVRKAQDLPDLAVALLHAHFPPDRQSCNQARKRLAYEEFLLLQLALAMRHRELKDDRQAPRIELTAHIDERIRRLYPFQLTADQDKVISEIVQDMACDRPMNRLLQGEVGSGKTAVAAYALLLAIAQKFQVALMAPTEVLAQQHWQTLEAYLQHSRVRRLLLTGAHTSRQRRESLEAIAAGEIDLVVGTQAIIQEDVQFANLGLVVIDEQHKFGVKQRARFRHKGLDPHYLVMTATPIPRTLAMTVFGDLDSSCIRQQPPGRLPIRTYLVRPEERVKSFEFVRKKLAEGRQGYVICPLVEQSDALNLHSAEQVAARLRAGPLAQFRVGLIHGRMDPQQKEQAMQSFRTGQTQVLVSTLVVEVGVDVPNATVMMVLDAHRFGLSQLHQLRGRIGRGAEPGFCFLFSDAQNPESLERLQVLVQATDGFRIAEEDLRLRGPGEFLGTRQHGLPELRAGDLVRDAALISLARRDAFAIVQQDPQLQQPEHALLRQAMLRRYGQSLELAGVG